MNKKRHFNLLFPVLCAVSMLTVVALPALLGSDWEITGQDILESPYYSCYSVDIYSAKSDIDKEINLIYGIVKQVKGLNDKSDNPKFQINFPFKHLTHLQKELYKEAGKRHPDEELYDLQEELHPVFLEILERHGLMERIKTELHVSDIKVQMDDTVVGLTDLPAGGNPDNPNPDLVEGGWSLWFVTAQP